VVGCCERLKLEQFQRQLLGQHDVAVDEIADRREAPDAKAPVGLIELVDIHGKARPNAIAPAGGSTDHLERPVIGQLLAL
jgi:hypothetical protein